MNLSYMESKLNNLQSFQYIGKTQGTYFRDICEISAVSTKQMATPNSDSSSNGYDAAPAQIPDHQVGLIHCRVVPGLRGVGLHVHAGLVVLDQFRVGLVGLDLCGVGLVGLDLHGVGLVGLDRRSVGLVGLDLRGWLGPDDGRYHRSRPISGG